MKDHIINLDKPRKLRYGFKAIRMIRQKFGDKSIENILNINVDEVPTLAWAGLKWEDNTLTLEQVEDLLDAAIPEKYTIMSLIELIMGAMAAQVGVQVKKAPAGEAKVELTVEKSEKKAEKKAEKTEAAETIPSSRKHKSKP